MANSNLSNYSSLPDLTDAQIEAARARGQASLRSEFHAETAWYEADRDLVWIRTTAGIYHGIPSQKLQGLSGASPSQIADIEVSPQGVGLHWPQLDADLTVQGIMTGLYGSEAWMAAAGRKGGQSKSAKKTAAARANGKKGGRPRKNASREGVSKEMNKPLMAAEPEGTYRLEESPSK